MDTFNKIIVIGLLILVPLAILFNLPPQPDVVHFEFDTQLGADSTVKIPTNVVAQIDGTQTLRVVLLVPDEDDEDRDWRRLATEQFLKGYAESDAIYDNYDELSEG